MGVDYNQYCYVGFTLDANDLRVVVSPEVVEYQNRYDPKTGEITHQEEVVVKDEIAVYKFYDILIDDEDVDDLSDIVYEIEERYEVSCHYDSDEEVLLVGIDISSDLKPDEYSKISLLDGEVSIEELNNLKKEIQDKFPDREISLVFYSHVG